MMFVGSPGIPYEAETLALIARFSTPPTGARAKDINDLVRVLKSDGLWAKCHVLFLFAAADSQASRLNWIGNTHNATLSGSPTFVADRGWTGVASGALATDYDPNTSAALNSATLGVWSRTVGTDAHQMAGCTDGVAFFDIYPRHTTGNFYASINQAAVTGGANSDGSGFFLASRRLSNEIELYRNGVSQTTGTNVSTSRPSGRPVYFAGVNDQGTISGNLGQCAAGWIGEALSDSESAALYTALAAYMTAVGA